MTALVAVDDFRLAACQCSVQAIHNKGFLQSAGQLIIDNLSAIPIDDDKEIHEAFLHPEICNIDSPDLIGTADVQISEQVGTNILFMVTLAEIGLGIDRINAHLPHQSADLLAINGSLVITTNDLRDRSVTPGWMIRMQLIDSAHEKQVFIGDRLLLRRPAIHAAPVDAKQFGLPANRNLGRLKFNEISSSSRVRGFL